MNRIAISFVCAAFCFAGSAFAKVQTWRQETASAFGKGKRERVVVTENGRVRLGQALQPTAKLDATRVWDLARTPKGSLFAATGDAGKVFRNEGKENGPWELAYDAADTQALSLAVLPDGRVFVGTGPSGRVVDVTDPKHPSSRPDPAVQYIWDLAADALGNLYAATGPTGQLWKRSPEGKWSLILDSKHAHLLCVAVGPDGSLYAGSDGEGLIYRAAPGGKISVVYDAPQGEVRTLLFAPDGVLYAGTAAESSGGGTPRGPRLFTGGTASHAGPAHGPQNVAAVPEPPEAPKPPDERPAPKSSPSRPHPGGSASPKPAAAGENAVFRIDSDGVPREVFRAKVLIFALAWQADRLLIGTGPEGQIYELRGRDHEAAPIARLDNGQILALLAEPEGGILVGAGDPGAVVRLTQGHVATGSLVSDVHDTNLTSRFGTLTWRVELPGGTSAAIQVRTGNVGEPDETWSAWSAEQTAPEDSKPLVPPGRFVQYKATLSTKAPNFTPELRSISLRYQTANLPPEISRIDVPDLSAADGATRQTKLTFRWDVNDPNDDELNYVLHIRKEGWPQWVRLGEDPLTDKNYAWDSTTMPAGIYRLRISASDRPSNPPAEAQSRDRESEPFLVDHEAPAVELTARDKGATANLRDNLTRLTKAAYSVDGGEWVPVFPDDGLFDQSTEKVTINLPELKSGAHVMVVRATDAAGNAGSGDVLIHVR